MWKLLRWLSCQLNRLTFGENVMLSTRFYKNEWRVAICTVDFIAYVLWNQLNHCRHAYEEEINDEEN